MVVCVCLYPPVGARVSTPYTTVPAIFSGSNLLQIHLASLVDLGGEIIRNGGRGKGRLLGNLHRIS